jgi:peptide/nickel transport system permease protein
MIPVVIGVTIIAFFLIHLIPGDPARTLLGVRATDQAVAALHERWGLDEPLWEQYAMFMQRLFQGDLGESFFYRVPASELIVDRLPVTLWLLAYGTILSILIAVPLATLAATRKNGARDHVVRTVPMVGLGMPQFWVGIMLILLFALKLGWFPVGGFGEGFTGHLRSMFLPSLTVALAIAPILVRSLRVALLDVLESDYVATARSKGIAESRIMTRHALRNAVISTVVILGVNIGFLVGGTIVIEKVFALPGIGALMIDSIFNRDFAVVQGITLFYALLVILVYLVTDLTHATLDPRVKLT